MILGQILGQMKIQRGLYSILIRNFRRLLKSTKISIVFLEYEFHLSQLKKTPAFISGEYNIILSQWKYNLRLR